MIADYSITSFFISLLLMCCAPKEKNQTPFEAGMQVGVNKNRDLEETSGLVASVMNPGYLWAHNDSGNPAELFLMDTHALTKKVFKVAAVTNRDWEDITLGTGPDENVYLFIGDIGDNMKRYPVKYIYRILEPSIEQEEISKADTLVVILSDGRKDAEAIMSDPVSHNLYLISKLGNGAGIYEITQAFADDTTVAKNVGTLPYRQITAANISPDGNEVLIKNYKNIYYWKKKGNESITDLLKTPATELPYDPEPQGEAIAWARDGSGFYTLGENAKGERAKMFYYRRK